jgi:hypothetical protein
MPLKSLAAVLEYTVKIMINEYLLNSRSGDDGDELISHGPNLLSKESDGDS